MDFLQGLLHFVLAEVPLAGARGGPNVVGAESLGDGDELDRGRVPAGAAGSRVDPGPDSLEGSDNSVEGQDSYLMYALSISKFSVAFLAFGPVGAILV